MKFSVGTFLVLGLVLSAQTSFAGDAADCYNATPSDLSQQLSVELCEGATSTAPADCYKDTPSDLSVELSVRLCRGATSIEPAECYKRTPSDLDAQSSVELCRVHNQCDGR